MKKLIQLFSIFSVIAGFSILSANAQTAQRYEAKVPFNFNIGNKSYEAGSYILRVTKVPAGEMLFVENDKNQRLQSIFVTDRGDIAPQSSRLTFTRNDNGWVLAKILTVDKGFSLAGVKTKSTLAKNTGSANSGTDTASVELK